MEETIRKKLRQLNLMISLVAFEDSKDSDRLRGMKLCKEPFVVKTYFFILFNTLNC